MKQAITTILTLFVLLTAANSQTAKPSKETIRDFSVSFYYKYKFEKNQSLQACAYLAGNRLGYSLVDIQVAVEKLETDAKFREELLKIMVDLYKADEEFFTLNLISIGMKATNAKELARYIIYKKENSKPEGLKEKKEGDKLVFEKVDIDASFPGGSEAWKKYLEGNLHAEVPKGTPADSYTVIVQFVVDKEGNVSDVKSLTNFGYGLEEEAIRVIKDGPKWIPAEQHGRKVKAYRKQNITFVVEEADSIVESKESILEPNKDKLPKTKFLLPEPEQIFKFSYTQLIDSLKRFKITYRKDSAFAEDILIGYHVTTEDGEYYFSKKLVLGSYSFKIPISIDKVYNYYLNKRLPIKNPQEGYYLCNYKNYIIAFLKSDDDATRIDYNRK